MVPSEFAYYVPRTLNRTVPAYRTAIQVLKRTVPTYRTRTITRKTYRTNVAYPYHKKKAYRTSVPYFLTKIEAYRTNVPCRTVLPSLPGPLNSKFCSMSIPITVAHCFSKVFCCIKTGEVEVSCY